LPSWKDRANRGGSRRGDKGRKIKQHLSGWFSSEVPPLRCRGRTGNKCYRKEIDMKLRHRRLGVLAFNDTQQKERSGRSRQMRGHVGATTRRLGRSKCRYMEAMMPQKSFRTYPKDNGREKAPVSIRVRIEEKGTSSALKTRTHCRDLKATAVSLRELAKEGDSSNDRSLEKMRKKIKSPPGGHQRGK